MRTAIGTTLLLVLSAALALASTDQIVEETTIIGDVRLSQTRTLGVELESTAVPGETQTVAGEDGTLLWVDTIHLNGIAANMAISGDGSTVVGGWWLNSARVALYDAQGTGVPNWTVPISTSFFVPVDASNDGSIVTGTGRQDLLYAWDAASPIPSCAEAQPAGHEGYGAMTPDVGGSFAGAAFFQGGDSKTNGHDSGCGDLFESDLTATVQGGRFAAQGDWVAVNSRTEVHVYNATTGALRASVPIPGETQATVGISGDGNIIAIGGFSRRTRCYEWTGAAYVELWSHYIPGVTWITAVDVSDDGSTVMVGTVLLTAPYLGRVVMYDVASGPTPLWTSSDFGDEVQSVALSADGSIGLAGSWGRLGGTFGHNVAAWNRDNSTPFFTIGDDEIPGVASVFSVDISNDGTAGCAGGKAVHAREMGSGGYAMAFELQGTTAVSPGGNEVSLLAESQLQLGRNMPNPLNPTTAIPFTLGIDAPVRLRIFDSLGRTVRIEDLGFFDAGSHQVTWSGADGRGRQVPSGVYFYQLDAAGTTATRRLVVAR